MALFIILTLTNWSIHNLGPNLTVHYPCPTLSDRCSRLRYKGLHISQHSVLSSDFHSLNLACLSFCLHSLLNFLNLYLTWRNFSIWSYFCKFWISDVMRKNSFVNEIVVSNLNKRYLVRHEVAVPFYVQWRKAGHRCAYKLGVGDRQNKLVLHTLKMIWTCRGGSKSTFKAVPTRWAGRIHWIPQR